MLGPIRAPEPISFEFLRFPHELLQATCGSETVLGAIKWVRSHFLWVFVVFTKFGPNIVQNDLLGPLGRPLPLPWGTNGPIWILLGTSKFKNGAKKQAQIHTKSYKKSHLIFDALFWSILEAKNRQKCDLFWFQQFVFHHKMYFLAKMQICSPLKREARIWGSNGDFLVSGRWKAVRNSCWKNVECLATFFSRFWVHFGWRFGTKKLSKKRLEKTGWFTYDFGDPGGG